MQTNWKRIFLVCLIVSLSAAALLAIGVFIIGSPFGRIEERILFTSLLAGACSLTGLSNAVLHSQDRKSLLALSGMGVSLAAFSINVLSAWDIAGLGWDIFSTSRMSFKLCATLLILAITSAQASLLGAAHKGENPPVRTSLKATLFFIGVVTVMLLAMIFEFHFAMTDIFKRALGVFAVLDALGTLVTPLLKWVVPAGAPVETQP